jgi:antitoxin (DNA-binding transcriptional repressor) of toxin-antitoxin stability system
VWYDEAMRVTASKLRENVYRILDEAIATGVPVEVVRKGKVLKIVPDKPVSKLDRLKKRKNVFVGDVEDIIGMDWSKEWTEMQ